MTLSIQKQAPQSLNLFNILAIFAGDYFAYLGFRSLFILFLTEKMLFTDQISFQIYGTLTALIYIVPIFGGFLAENFLGHKPCVVIGSLLMMIGYLLFGIFDTSNNFFWFISIIICGNGFFRSNIACLLGNLYENNIQARESGFIKLYISGYAGAFIATISCGVVSTEYGWNYGFILAGIGMGIGILLFLLNDLHYSFKISNYKNLLSVKNPYFFTVIIAIPFLYIIHLIFVAQAIEICIILIIPISVLILFKVYIDNRHLKKELVLIICLMLISLVFWMIEHQGGSTLNLFIKRVVDRSVFSLTIPASSFQSIGLLSSMLGGILVNGLWRYLKKKSIRINTLIKLSLGNICLIIGFTIFTYVAKLGSTLGQKPSFVYIVVALLLIGIAEIFISPTVMSSITSIGIKKATSSLISIYILLCGSVANYLASKIAKWSAVSPNILLDGNIKVVSLSYYHAFSYYLLFAIILFVVGLVIAYLFRKY